MYRMMIQKVHPNATFTSCSTDKPSTMTTHHGFRWKYSGSKYNSKSDNNNDNGKGYYVVDDQYYQKAVTLTVWKKSLLMNCTGFTVFDANGNLVFRVDNYVAANKGEIVLMDAGGKPLLTIRRKRLSWGDNWLVYDGDTTVNPKCLVQKQTGNLLNNSKTASLAHVLALGSSVNKQEMKHKNTNTHKSSSKHSLMYQMEGSYAQRSVVVYNNKRQCVAEIKRKETARRGVALGGDVFSLVVVRPDEIDTAFAMALVILLDQMFGSS